MFIILVLRYKFTPEARTDQAIDIFNYARTEDRIIVIKKKKFSMSLSLISSIFGAKISTKNEYKNWYVCHQMAVRNIEYNSLRVTKGF